MKITKDALVVPFSGLRTPARASGGKIRNVLHMLVVVTILATVGTLTAHADPIIDGTINFVVTSGSPAPTGSFVLDSATNTFTSFLLNWDGAVFNLSGLVGDSISFSGENWCGFGPNLVGSCGTLGLLSNDFAFFNSRSALSDSAPAASFTDPTAEAFGTWTLTETPVTTPEPPSLLLLATGLLALAGITYRKKLLA